MDSLALIAREERARREQSSREYESNRDRDARAMVEPLYNTMVRFLEPVKDSVAVYVRKRANAYVTYDVIFRYHTFEWRVDYSRQAGFYEMMMLDEGDKQYGSHVYIISSLTHFAEVVTRATDAREQTYERA